MSKWVCLVLVVMLVAFSCVQAAEEEVDVGRKLAAGEEAQELWYKKGYHGKKGGYHHKGPWKKGYGHKGGYGKGGYGKGGPGHPHD